MERPTGPLPPIPNGVEGIVKGEDVLDALVLTPQQQQAPPPGIQPNDAITEVVGMDDRRNSEVRLPSLASSTESTVASSMAITSSPRDEEQIAFSMNPDDYKIGPAIGFGSSAIVYHTTYSPLQRIVAVKMIDLDHFERNQIDELRREIQVMTLCKHSNLLKIHASFVHESKLWIVTPYLSGGSCLDIMKTGFRDGLDESSIATILLQALQGLEYLHRNGHIHRDVKAGNLLMDADGGVQLADFGVSSCLTEDVDRRGVRKTFVGTPCWMAPEVMEMTRGYDAKADIWSFGITALELAYGHAPFSKYPPMKVIYLTLSSAPPALDRKRSKNKYSRTLKEMIDSCLQRDPSKRPTAEVLLKHPFFKAAKKPSYLASTILSMIPPLEQRPRVTKLMKQMAEGGYKQINVAEWDFSAEESGTETDIQGTEPSTAPNSPGATEDENGGTVNTIGEMRLSRFTVEQEPPPSSSPTSPAPNCASPADSDKTASGEVGIEGNDEESGVRKGRFSVLESARDNPSPHLEETPTPTRSIDGEEDGRRSRFKVETSTVPHESPRVASPVAANGSRFHVSQPLQGGGGGRTDHHRADHHGVDRHNVDRHSVDHVPPPFNTDVPYHTGQHHIYDNDNYPPPTSYPPPIFVHPSQIDQLLLLNELIRQQLVELRNTTTGRSARTTGLENMYASTSYHPTIHAGSYEESPQNPYWEPRMRGPMVEDPHVAFPPHISSYSPAYEMWPSHPEVPSNFTRPDTRSTATDPRIFSKRRSMSIDYRSLYGTDPRLSNLTQPRPTSTLAGRHSNLLPRSPTGNPLADGGLDNLKRELETLRRENDQLRSKNV